MDCVLNGDVDGPIRDSAGRRLKRRKLALYHISEQLGVSTSTVSLAMRDSPRIPCATRARVKAALSATGYVYHRRAAALRTSKTCTVGVIVDDLSDPFVRILLASLEGALAAAGRTVFLCHSAESVPRQSEFIRTMSEYDADGVIVRPAIGSTPEDFTACAHPVPPLVFVSRAFPDLPFDCVVADEGEAASLAVRHLIDLDHRRIALLGPERGVGASEQWLGGYRQALQDASVECDETLVRFTHATRTAGYSAGGWIAGLDPRPSAVICSSTAVALGLSSALPREGLGPGRDIALVAHEDVEEAGLVVPRLTVTGPSPLDMGAQAVSVLRERMEGSGAPPRRVVLTPQLVVRASSAGVFHANSESGQRYHAASSESKPERN